jgi:hypothetical protein
MGFRMACKSCVQLAPRGKLVPNPRMAADQTDPDFLRPPDQEGSDELGAEKKKKVAEVLAGLDAAVPKVPDWMRVQTAETKGEKFAAYQAGPRPLNAAVDTLPPQPAVVLDQTDPTGLLISASEIRRATERRHASAEDREDRQAREEITAPPVEPRRKDLRAVVALALLLSVALVVAAMARRSSPEPISETPVNVVPPSAAVPSSRLAPVQPLATEVAPPAVASAAPALPPVRSTASARTTLPAASAPRVRTPATTASGTPDKTDPDFDLFQSERQPKRR